VLSTAEHRLLSSLVEELPANLRETIETQFAEYNLVQREADGRALNFYRVGLFSSTPLSVSPLLESKQEEALLIRLAAHIGETEPLHATLTAVRGRVFCASFSRRVPRNLGNEFKIGSVVHAWKSNFRVISAG
jgi:hypothetical protein